MAYVRGGITVKPHVQKFADAVVEKFGESLSPGTYNGHSPPEGPTQALDLFTPNTPAGWALQARICNWIITNAKRFGVRYAIRWNPTGRDWIWNIERASEGWRAMATRDHSDHVHVTFYDSAGVGVNEPKPDQLKEMESMTFLIGFTSGEHKGQVWLWDSAGRLWTYVGDPSAQRAAEKVGVPYAGDYDGSVWAYWNSLAQNAGFTG